MSAPTTIVRHAASVLGSMAVLAAAVALSASPLAAAPTEVRLGLPVRAQIALDDRRTIAALPFVVLAGEGEGRVRGRDIDVRGELERYLVKLLRRDTPLEVVEAGAVALPTYDLDMLSRDDAFWRALGAELGTDLLLVGSVDFDIHDRSGYRTEETVSPYDGRPYRIQVLVEETGFEFDIVLQVYDGRTGALLYDDNFKDFKQYEGDAADPLAGMFQNLYALEDRIVGIFAQKRVQVTRVLFAP